MKIAVTSQNFLTITPHAGKCRRFLILGRNEQGELVELDRLDLPKEMSMHEFKGLQHPLFDSDVLLTASAGQGFIRRLQQERVEVICTSETDPYRAADAFLEGAPLPAVEADAHHQKSAPIMPKFG
ncbi:MAG: nitrogen fixation protein [Candidatus Thiodiazotropha lotti]|nr:nitrogen fixation protein [Candidatus Thiodiazotropha lotti]MCG8000355.1 nitrogen fixation protein [Candidatus Thiodiazotropha lotti]MCW4183985.1 nitrogen fixation protein [Candidatus Thiodiazotropha weberae]MCW4192125.1 nitrogen fixation protein [Candidatus Thiodiazotropha weberae]